MHSAFRWTLLTASIFSLVACISLPEHRSTQADLKDCRHRYKSAQQRLQQLENELSRADARLDGMQAEVQRLRQTDQRRSTELAELQKRYEALKKVNAGLAADIDKLSADLEKKKSLIQLQQKVIRLLDDTKKTIETSLKEQVQARSVAVQTSGNRLKVILVDKILFDSGSTEINADGKQLLRVLADSLRAYAHRNIIVEGHTDNVPLSPRLKQRFASNWELSSARAAAVVRFLQREGHLDPTRLSARGYSYFHPVASNRTEAGRSKNRRIEIILAPVETPSH